MASWSLACSSSSSFEAKATSSRHGLSLGLYRPQPPIVVGQQPPQSLTSGNDVVLRSGKKR